VTMTTISIMKMTIAITITITMTEGKRLALPELNKLKIDRSLFKDEES